MHRGPRTAFRAAIVGVLLTASLLITSLAGADADSVIFGTAGNDTLAGTPAADAIFARAGDDKISGGAGDDDIDGGAGADTISGGDGNDTVLYSGTAPVEANLDGQPGDGPAGENDQILADVENLYGGDGNDKLTGNDGPNTIGGGAGDDRIIGGRGVDMLAGDEGDDVIDARDGEIDRVDCGPGDDTANVDLDDLVTDCEHVAKPGLTQKPLVGIKNGRLALASVANGSKIRVVCAKGRCGARGATLVERSSAKKDKRGFVTFKLTTRLKRKLRASTIEVGVTAPDSTTACKQYRITSKLKISVVRSGRCSTAARGL